MNKYLVGLFLYSFGSQAQGPSDVLIVLEAFNHRGILVHKEVVLIQAAELTVNGEKLSPSEIITQSAALKKISQLQLQLLDDKKNAECNLGVFKHSFKKGKILKVERGCLNNDRYNELLAAFSALKKDKITQ